MTPQVEEPSSIVDVLVAGGGPAGAACALTLLRYSGRSVLVADRAQPGVWRIGETIGPAVAPLLDWLDMGHLLTAGEHLPSAGTAAAWGGPALLQRDFLFSGRGDAWHLDRARFDGGLAEGVRARGGALLDHTRIASLVRSERGWRVGLVGADGRSQTVSARFVVDATGKAAVVGRKLGAERRRVDSLVGVSGIFALPPDGSRESITVVEAVEEGWWYLALLPGRRLVVTLMSDLDLVRRGGWCREPVWRERVTQTRHIQARLEGAQLLHPLIVRPATSQRLDQAAGEGWVAVGEAAAAFDPLSSMGIGYAITTGIHGARAVDAALGGEPALLPTYSADVERHFREILETRQRYYSLERRWPAAPFWARRNRCSQE
jgi:flavin-dependent dehydrogenase